MSPQTRRPLAAALGALLIASALLAGCGQKGPLYLPDGNAKSQQQKKDAGAQ